MSSSRQTVGIVFGGRSGEHPVSVRSSRFVFESLDHSRFAPVLIGIDRAGDWHLLSEAEYADVGPEVHAEAGLGVVPVRSAGRCALFSPKRPRAALPTIDVIFPILHGPYGEDGTIQGLLDLIDVPYVGVGVLGAALCMDKDVCKRLLREAGIPVVPFIAASARNWARDADTVRQGAAALGRTVFVKPASLGSSLGVSRVADPAGPALDAAIAAALALDAKVIIERGIDGRELECAVLGNDEPLASVVGEIVPGEAFYSYDDKYAADSQAELHIPADLDHVTHARVRDAAIRAFRVLECSGMARVDFFLDRATGELYVNELNTIPGFTAISMYPKLWEATGIPGAALVTRLVELAQERSAGRRCMKA